MALDHGSLNLPIGHRGRGGSINRQIDEALKRERLDRRNLDREGRRRVIEMKARVRTLLDRLSDERVLELAKPLGCRKPETARAKLYSAASSKLASWIAVLEREVGDAA